MHLLPLKQVSFNKKNFQKCSTVQIINQSSLYKPQADIRDYIKQKATEHQILQQTLNLLISHYYPTLFNVFF